MLAWLKGAKSTKERYELSPVIASADRSVSETLKQSGSASRKRICYDSKDILYYNMRTARWINGLRGNVTWYWDEEQESRDV